MKRAGVLLILVLALSGLADSAYIAQHERSGTPLICDIENLSGCNTVVASPYSYLFGIPLAEYGILFYAIVFVLAALEFIIFDQLLRRALQAISFIGVLASAYFTFVQVYFIDAFCIYCLASALIALLILILTFVIEPFEGRMLQRSPAPPLAG